MAGLVMTVLAPARQGGGGQQWPIAYQLQREIASAGGAPGSSAGTTFSVELAAAIQTTASGNRWFVAGTISSPANPLWVLDDNPHLVFNGRQKFAIGSAASVVTALDGHLDDTDLRHLAVVPTRHPGLTFHTDADDHEEHRSTPADQPRSGCPAASYSLC